MGRFDDRFEQYVDVKNGGYSTVEQKGRGYELKPGGFCQIDAEPIPASLIPAGHFGRRVA